MPSCAQVCLKDKTSLSCYWRPSLFFFLLESICYWKSSVFFKVFFRQNVPLCVMLFTVPLSWVCISYFSAFIDAVEWRGTEISQINFQVSVPKRFVLNLKAWMPHGNWKCTSGFLWILPVGFFVEVGVDSVWFRSVLLALLFILVTSIGIYKFVVFVGLIE